jgi:type IX secretion system PorP/SprF family membrane protein
MIKAPTIKDVLISLLFIFGSWQISNAQQDPLYSQYAFSLLAVNPAYSGFNNFTSFSINSRFQWAGIEGSPTTNIFTSNSSFFDGKAGLGMVFSNDRIGINSTTEGHLSYSYKIKMNDLSIHFGLQTGFVRFKYEVDDLTLRVFDDPLFSPSEEQATKPNFGAGIIITGDKWLAGFSVPKALNNDFDKADFNGIKYQRHYYLTGAYLYQVNSGLIIKPTLLLRAVKNAPASVNFNTTAIINNKYWVGLFTNNLSTFGAITQLELSSRYKFGYSFEVSSGGGFNTRLASHEFFLSVNLELFKNQKIIQQYF